MRSPFITVVIRYIESDGWKNGFPVACVKKDDGTYSNMYGVDKTFKEDIVYKGECPSQLRILPNVEREHLHHYMHFYSQLVPSRLNKNVANAVRGTCPINMLGGSIYMFDHECYHPSGKIICLTLTDSSDELKSYLTSLFKKEDWDRIKRFDDLGFDNWSTELYEKEKV